MSWYCVAAAALARCSYRAVRLSTLARYTVLRLSSTRLYAAASCGCGCCAACCPEHEARIRAAAKMKYLVIIVAGRGFAPLTWSYPPGVSSVLLWLSWLRVPGVVGLSWYCCAVVAFHLTGCNSLRLSPLRRPLYRVRCASTCPCLFNSRRVACWGCPSLRSVRCACVLLNSRGAYSGRPAAALLVVGGVPLVACSRVRLGFQSGGCGSGFPSLLSGFNHITAAIFGIIADTI